MIRVRALRAVFTITVPLNQKVNTGSQEAWQKVEKSGFSRRSLQGEKLSLPAVKA